MKNFKKVISSVIAFAIAASSFAAVSASSFSDVADTASYAEAVDVLAALGIVNGYEEDGAFTFKPEGEITRAEAATMIVGALNMTEDAKNSSSSCQFADVNEKASWAAGYVNVGVSEGFINGRSADEFDPQANVTYAEMCVMLTKITDYADYATSNVKEGDPWYKAYTDMAASAGLNKGVSVPLTSALKRGHVAQMIYNALVTPKLGIVEYSFVDNKYAPLDGTYSPEFKTILSEKFDGYVVTAEIVGTPKNGAENGEVNLDITKAAWWDDRKIEANDKAAEEKGITLNKAITGIEDLLFQSGTAVLLVDALDEVEMIYFKANSKMETKEVSLDEYVMQADRANESKFTDGKGIKIGTGSPIRVSKNAELYVNGVKVAAEGEITDNMLDKFLGNGIGNVTFVKHNKEINEFDKIFVTYYEVGEVTAVSYKGEKTTVRVNVANDAPGLGYTFASSLVIEINDESVLDEEVEVTVEKNGAAIELKELAKGDVIAFAVDFADYAEYGKATATIADPNFIKVLATDETIKGMVLDYDDDYRTYTIGENTYKFVGYKGDDLKVATTYELMLDPFGRILNDGEAISTGAKFAIVEKYDSNSEKVSLLLADGSTASYEIHSGSGIGTNDIAKFIKKDGELLPVQDRVVKYTVSGGAVKLVKVDAATEMTELDGDEYNSNTGKIGAINVNEELKIVNAQQHEESNSPSISDYEKFDAADFKTGVDYDGYAFRTGEVFSFLVITNIGTTFTEDSRFAVITKDPMNKIYDGSTCLGAEALYNGEAITLYSDTDLLDDTKMGDVVYFTTDAEGYLKSIHKIYDADSKNTAEDAFKALTEGAYDKEDWNFSFKKSTADIQIVSGYVAEVKNSSITLAVAKDGLINGNMYNDKAGEEGLFTFGIAADANAYIFDEAYDVSSPSKKYAAIEASAIVESNLVEQMVGGEEVDYVYDVETSLLNDAIAMVVNGDVVCIFVNYPEN